MRTKAVVAVAVALVSMIAVVQLGSEVDADDGDVWYVYSHDMSFFYQGGTQDVDSVEWDVVGVAGGSEKGITFSGPEPGDEWWTIYLDPSEVEGCSEVRVTQTVTKDGSVSRETNTYIPVTHLDPGEYIHVTFFDGYSGSVVDAKVISSSTVVKAGEDFVDLPGSPSRDGYSFLGWYTADGERFDPSQPIEDDVDLYARWMESSGTGGGSVSTVEVGAYLVTFVAPEGIVHEVVSIDDGVLSFNLSFRDGYTYDMESIAIDSDRGIVSSMGGPYVLSGITGDTVVTVTGDRIYKVVIETDHAMVRPMNGSDLGQISDDPFDAMVVAEDGYEISSVTIFMGDENVTGMYLEGDEIHVDRLTGDLSILAFAEPVEDGGFPWALIAVLVVVIAVVAVAAYAVHRRRSAI